VAPEASNEPASFVTLPPTIRSLIRIAVETRVAAASARTSAIEIRRSQRRRPITCAGSAATRQASSPISIPATSQGEPSDSRFGTSMRRTADESRDRKRDRPTRLDEDLPLVRRAGLLCSSLSGVSAFGRHVSTLARASFRA
jgi:hypothetical protein